MRNSFERDDEKSKRAEESIEYVACPDDESKRNRQGWQVIAESGHADSAAAVPVTRQKR